MGNIQNLRDIRMMDAKECKVAGIYQEELHIELSKLILEELYILNSHNQMM